ncbi:tRNA(Ile)-lysidine synthase [Ectothiorhodosinus mongolicus]|uniref:tRNA(Ile)-lysidine synthase n=1 Tax=Ectothiorhodosinus mongolicus TaxID=233100 RepID=A0A1R3VMQ3_9GAMM|nr:tRNA lysidine(34) synthetase TilS [Ectothiorhodosinus mongolicus]ULX56348.1 tRNA(Ile)-lysidine synthetase [Ectothiorhodosinus mongolicus]SIT65861.1 tRNA(Ile)-lysidine synthase [Ectothiorhodosinus mongolicus]
MLHTIAATLKQGPPATAWVVAYSGGRDSSVLLHALHLLCSEHSATSSLPPLTAVHVHHGLSAQADAWAQHCAQQCHDWGVPLRLLQVDARPDTGESLEAKARALRYAALAEALPAGGLLLTAHHARDQAETLLLQLLRGAGPAGLASMPRFQPFGGGWHGRPFLDLSEADIAAYAAQHKLHWVEDESNAVARADRNFLRHQVMPMLRQRWPGVDATLCRASGLQAEAESLLAERAREDVEDLSTEVDGTLDAAALLRLPSERQRNAVRGWLRERGLPLPNQARLREFLSQLRSAAADAQILCAWPSAELRVYRQRIHALKPLGPLDPTSQWQWMGYDPIWIEPLAVRLEPEVLRQRYGVAPEALQQPFTVRLRQGGERCRLRGQTHSLKKLLQEAGVPPWERDRIPLLYQGDELVIVWGFWRCESAAG